MNFLPSGPITKPAASFLTRSAFAFGILLAFFLCMPGAITLAGSPTDVPSITAGPGPCTADFLVVDATNKPVYDAKVHVKVMFGFMGKRNTDLEIGTNSDGKAHFEGLPNKVKKPLEYTIKSGDLTKTVINDPAAECHPYFNVTLAK